MTSYKPQTANHQETFLVIKRKYSNNVRKTPRQTLSKITPSNKQIAIKENYYESPSRFTNSTAQSNVKSIVFDTSRSHQESSDTQVRDYMTLKTEYTSIARNDNQHNNENQLQYTQNLSFRKQFNKANKEKIPRFGIEVDNFLSDWNKKRSIKTKELKQTQSHRANQTFEIKQKNHKVINEIDQMVVKIKNCLKDRNC